MDLSDVRDAVNLNDDLAALFERKEAMEANNESITDIIQAKIKQKPPVKRLMPPEREHY